MTFSKISADAKVTNGNSEYSYAGAEFDIYRTRDNALVAHITMGGNGHANYQLDPNENYYAVETKAPQGFQKHEGRIEFSTGNSAGEQQFKDDPGYVKITVAKKDSATSGDPQTSLSLEGAEYKCTSISTPGWEATGKTDAKGVLWFTRVPFGEIQIVETKAPSGYKLDTSVHTYTVRANEVTDTGTIELEPEDDFAENPQAFDVEIAKTKGGEDDSWESDNGHGKPAVGVQFQIISNSTGKVVGTLTTNESGFASTKDSDTCDETSISEDKTDDATRPWFGEGKRNAGIDGALPIDQKGYTIHEVDSTVPEGYDHVDDWTISADEEVNQSTKYYSVIDKTLTSRLQIVKCDAETGNTVLLSGFKFQILDADGKVVSFDDPYDVNAKVDTFTTDANGQVSMPGNSHLKANFTARKIFQKTNGFAQWATIRQSLTMSYCVENLKQERKPELTIFTSKKRTFHQAFSVRKSVVQAVEKFLQKEKLYVKRDTNVPFSARPEKKALRTAKVHSYPRSILKAQFSMS